MSEYATKHGRFSASGLGAMVPGRCPGKWRLTEKMPELDLGDGDLGTELHRLVEEVVNGRLALEEIKSAENRFLVGRCYHYLSTKGLLDVDFETEVKLPITSSDDLIIKGAGGTADFVAHRKLSNMAEVVDYKFVNEPLDRITAREQVKSYIVGACQKYGEDFGTGRLYLPRLDIEYTFETTEKDGLASIEATIANCLEEGSPLSSGSWCRWCQAKSICPVLTDEAQEALGLLPPPPAEVPKTRLKAYYKGQIQALVDSGELTKVARLLELSEHLTPAIEATRAVAKALLDEQPDMAKHFPGWEVKTKQVRNKPPILEVYKRIKNTLSDDEFADACSMSWGKLEDHYIGRVLLEAKENGHKMTKKGAKEMLGRLLGSISTTTERKELRRVK